MRPLIAKVSLTLVPLALAACLAACGGGGSGTSAGGGSSVLPTTAPTSAPTSAPTAPTATAAPTSAPTATPSPITVSGTAVEYTSGVALSGFTVTVGSIPSASTCLSTESNTAMPCGVPAAPAYTATTSAAGSFSVAVPAAGTYMLTIGNGTAYATLHRTITVSAGGVALGTVKITALSADEQAWVVDLNTQRATVSVPTSFSNLVIDEYAEEQARAEALAVASGAQPFGDATETLYGTNYTSEPGAMYQAGGAAALIGSAGAYLAADAGWMAEKANCPGGNWQTCTFAGNTGHYQNVSNTQNVWVGVGESATPLTTTQYAGDWAYDIITAVNYQASYPAAVGRAK